MVAGIFLFLWYTSFGSRHRHDVILHLTWDRSAGELGDLTSLLWRYSSRTAAISPAPDPGDQATDLSYRLLLRNPAALPDLLSELRGTPGVSDISTLRAEDESEV